MAANVESMFYVREVPWHGMGVKLDEAPNSEEAIVAAGLNWRVIPTPIYFAHERQQIRIPNRVANVRETDKQVLGIVSENAYNIVQNIDAFRFTDDLLGEGVRYVTAGSLGKGERIWLLAELPGSFKILGDDFSRFICFTNSHDGFSGVNVIATPVRVVCQNTLNLALQKASRSWSARHCTNINERLHEAKRTLQITTKYYNQLSIEAEILANQKVDYEEMVEKLFPMPEVVTNRQKANIEEKRAQILQITQTENLKQFRNTGWGFLNAVAEAQHITKLTNRDKFNQARMVKTIYGYPLLDRTYSLLKKAA